MRFKLPKPLHSWRKFAGEVGIIVLCVMIALAAEQDEILPLDDLCNPIS